MTRPAIAHDAEIRPIITDDVATRSAVAHDAAIRSGRAATVMERAQGDLRSKSPLLGLLPPEVRP